MVPFFLLFFSHFLPLLFLRLFWLPRSSSCSVHFTKSCPGVWDEQQYISEDHRLFDGLSRCLHHPQLKSNPTLQHKLTLGRKPSFMSFCHTWAAVHTLGFWCQVQGRVCTTHHTQHRKNRFYRPWKCPVKHRQRVLLPLCMCDTLAKAGLQHGNLPEHVWSKAWGSFCLSQADPGAESALQSKCSTFWGLQFRTLLSYLETLFQSSEHLYRIQNQMSTRFDALRMKCLR